MNRALATLLFALCATVASAAEPYSVDLELPEQVPRPPIEFMRFVHPDGRTVTYYAAGDRYLESAFALLDAYWSPQPGQDPKAIRARLKTFLPLELRKLRHEPAEQLMRHFTDSFFRTRNAKTKLVPFRSYLVYQTTEYFQRWFPDDRDLLQKNVELADAMIRYGDPCSGSAKCGMYGAIDAATGEPLDRTVRVQDYGLVAVMLNSVSARSGDARFATWAARKQDFIWNERLAAPLPLLADAYTPAGAVISTREPITSDSDMLYNVRRLFEMDALWRSPVDRERAMAMTDFWYTHAWNAEWGHFVRKLNPDGTPATDTLYGDGMYNTLWVLIHAYRVTGEQRYLRRVREAFANLRLMGVDGLLPRYVRQGEMIPERGLGRNQAMFLEILLEAYDASGDSQFLCDAEQLADSILANPARAMPDAATRGFAGAALLRLAMTRQSIRRFDVRAPSPRTQLTIRSASGNVLSTTTVPTDLVSVYAPLGISVILGNDSHSVDQ